MNKIIIFLIVFKTHCSDYIVVFVVLLLINILVVFTFERMY